MPRACDKRQQRGVKWCEHRICAALHEQEYRPSHRSKAATNTRRVSADRKGKRRKGEGRGTDGSSSFTL